MTHEINLTVASLPSHERLVVEIFIDGQFLALISQESEMEPPKIEFIGGEKDIASVFSVETVEEAINRAKKRLTLLDQNAV